MNMIQYRSHGSVVTILGDDWWGCGVIVEADLGGFGEVHASLWGLDANETKYVEEDVVEELLNEAEAEAEDAMYRRLLGGNVKCYDGWEMTE